MRCVISFFPGLDFGGGMEGWVGLVVLGFEDVE